MRGGARPGAGRKRRQQPKLISPIEFLLSRLKSMGDDDNSKIRKTVVSLSAYTATHDEIAAVIDVAPEMLRDKFAEELKIGEAILAESLAANIWRAANGDGRRISVAALVWLLKQTDQRGILK